MDDNSFAKINRVKPLTNALLSLFFIIMAICTVVPVLLVVSISMAFVQLSNGVMPFLGVQIYNAFGANFNAFIIFNLIVLALRCISMGIFIVRYLRLSKTAAA